MMFALIVLLVGLGLYPQPVIDAARAPVQAFDAMYSLQAAAPAAAGVAP